MIRLSEIKIDIREVKDSQTENEALRKKILSRLGIGEKELKEIKIYKKSIDARKKNNIFLVYAVDAEVSNEKRILERNRGKGITPAPKFTYEPNATGIMKMEGRPVIIGTGPAGLFAGLVLSRNGYKPIILERGDDVDTRTEKIKRFWTEAVLDTESNVQFGEGGAGTFSDGKLTTLVNDIRCRYILEEFVKAGAPADILYWSKPHIGTDLLKSTIKNIRQQILAYGGEVRFRAKVTDFIIKDGRMDGVVINNEEFLPCRHVLLAIGHSARDTFEVLHKRGIYMTQKPFSIGVRIEHPQTLINRAQYGDGKDTLLLPAADYKLSYHSRSGRSAYTFCMCPGGFVVAAASEKNRVVTNGMSEHKRDGENANSAVLVGINPEDFLSDHPLAGIEFQRKWESLAFKAGGCDYRAPAQLIGDFLLDRQSTAWGDVRPTYKPGVVFAPLKECLPDYVTDTLKEAILYFDTKLKGFAIQDGIMTGVETRSSSPVRINRDENFESNIRGLYPVGEGAGYAGGIMSSAIDGVKTAEKIMEKYAPLKSI